MEPSRKRISIPGCPPGVAQHAVRILCAILGMASAATGSEPGEIAAMGEAYVEAFNRGDAAAISAIWSPEGDYIGLSGMRTAGRDRIEALFAGFFARNKRAQIEVRSESLRWITPDLALEDGTTAVLRPGELRPSRSRFSNTWARQDGKWALLAVRETPVSPANHPPELAKLAWLVGHWEARTPDGESVRLQVAPVMDGNFLVAERTLVANGQAEGTGLEWIAWDPARKQIRSWSLQSDGGFGESFWTPAEGAWQVESTHTLRDGSGIREVQSLHLGSDGEVTVKTISLSSEGKDLAPQQEMVFRRVGSPP
jgi:uncharacterized protein (TIGR02246 family)